MRNISKIALLAHLLTSAGLSFAATSYPGQVPVTGENSTTAGSQSGVAWPIRRFEAGSGSTQNCIIDKLTGLMWAKNGNLFGGKSWNDALSVVIQMNKNSNATGYKLCGFDDWRVPNIIELRSLINYSQNSQPVWLKNQGFINVQANNYWSSTSYAPVTNSAWYVNFLYGNVEANGKNLSNYVWPVRRVP
jgi:hypothetical protein